ncbi:glycoside hydrolase family 2 protein [Bacteroides sp. 519]|uniref:glycoside hydrolase family 2 protein n=1 Tax=Bacteroides sp. 519 TaxID=2302937 RepID=UPI0013CFD3A7|nr:sugar-binding domain-containing protein [Bacteroides sp. 519]NDV57850.1 glycoside hydrolase family 2 [Bacteroides sp. 519]
MKKSKILLVLSIIASIAVSCTQPANEINLSGQWEVALDSLDRGITEKWYEQTFQDKITLPGTLCDAGYGTPCTLEPVMEKEIFLNLKRKYDYVGVAWYKREITIPTDWANCNIILTLERVIWNSQVWINGKKVEGFNQSLSTPHYFDLGEYLEPGKSNILAIRIDNSKQHDISVRDLAHAYTNDTQTMWNGILGQIALTVKEKAYIQELRLTPDVDNAKVNVAVKVSSPVSGQMQLTVKSPSGKTLPAVKVQVDGKETSFEYAIKDPLLWDEFNPNIYEATATLESDNGIDSKSETFGMRKLTNNNALLQINGNRIFLRGTLECCIFPLKGYPPTDKAGWEKVFNAARDYGLNHIRFHSWCPPKAAFEVADRMGFYLQVELPLWVLTVGKDEPTMNFLYDEANRIMKEYGNHPSFCFWSLGNELQGDFTAMDKLLTNIKERDNRHLYMTTSFTFEQGHGGWPEPNDDFWVTQWTNNGWVRGQGIFDDQPAGFNMDYSASIQGLPVPLITHEIGQYSVFPNLKEIDKYTGNLMPLNFKAVAKDLEKKGRLHLAEDNLKASGKLAVILYKEEIERALKTPGFSGFQLLDLHDFPGQGTALVGIIDAFWESKGLITPEEFRRFCAPVVPLVRFAKATYMNNETFEAAFEVANFSNRAISGIQPEWSLSNPTGTVIAKGELNKQDVAIGNGFKLGNISVPLNTVTTADKLTLSVKFKGTDYQNSWDLWVYPQDIPAAGNEVFYTQSFAEAEKALQQGKKVLLNPKKEDINGLEGKFVQVFWSPVHFPNQPGTMGVLCDPSHPALAHFPTEMHSNWQWWDICKNAKTMELDGLKQNMQPIIRMVDNFYKNRNLGLVFEAKAGKGKLLVSSSDLSSQLESRPVARQLRYSLMKYMESSEFNPQEEVSFDVVRKELHNVGKVKEEKRSIYE